LIHFDDILNESDGMFSSLFLKESFQQ